MSRWDAAPSLREELRHQMVSNPDRVLYPDAGITKKELAAYYAQIVDWIRPHVEGRLLSLVRCPEGYEGECFYQQHPAEGTSDDIRRMGVRKSGNKDADYMYVDDVRGLLALVQLATLEIHTWGARIDRLERPDRLVFDLDPDPSLPWERVVDATQRLGAQLGELGLKSWVKTTGGKGVHIVVPIERRTGWDEVRTFAKAVAENMERRDAELFVSVMSKSRRGGRVFVDYLRNSRGATFVAPYSARAHAGAPVSAPITWEELGAGMRSDALTLRDMPRRLAELEQDPWKGFFEVQQSITQDMRKQVGLE